MTEKNKETSISEIIKRRKYNLAVKEGYQSLLIRIIFLIIVGFILFTQMFLVTRNTGMNMFPSVKDGDLVLGYRLQNDYQKDDVIIYKQSSERRIGRIVAREGDMVTIDDAGTVFVNGTIQTGEILYPTYPKDGIEYPYQVPEGCVFILGDYRTQSEDSRDWGAISMKQVEGKVITILRRRGI